MTTSFRRLPGAVRVLPLLIVLVLCGLAIYLLTGGGTKRGTAYFEVANGIYPGDSVVILGIEVGKVDKLTSEGDKVRVEFHYDSDYALPAQVKAAILSPTLVATRQIQLDPPYGGGPQFPDGGTIPVERTVVPVEFDELKDQLDQVAKALGPNGVNENGAINRALTVIDKNGMQDGVGQGKPFHDMIDELSKATDTLSTARGDLFGTVDNLAHFSTELNRYDNQIVEFQRHLGSVSGTLDDNSEQLRELLPRLDDAGAQVDKFLTERGPQLTDTIDRAGSVARAIAKVRDSMAQALHVGPNTLTNFANLIHPRTGVLYGALTVQGYQNSLGSPGNQVCALITQASGANEFTAQQQCARILGPVFSQLITMSPLDFQTQALPNIPLVPAPLTVPHGSTPSYGDLDHQGPNAKDYEGSPNWGNSDLPRSTSSDRSDKSYSDNGFPIPGVPTQNPVIGGGGK